MRKLLLLITSVTLSSCLGPKWVSDIKPPELLDLDSRNCQIYSYEKFPANLYTINVTKHKEIDISNQHTTGNINGITHSNSTKQTILVPYTTEETRDANSTPRRYAFEQCMIENGWYQAK